MRSRDSFPILFPGLWFFKNFHWTDWLTDKSKRLEPTNPWEAFATSRQGGSGGVGEREARGTGSDFSQIWQSDLSLSENQRDRKKIKRRKESDSDSGRDRLEPTTWQIAKPKYQVYIIMYMCVWRVIDQLSDGLIFGRLFQANESLSAFGFCANL